MLYLNKFLNEIKNNPVLLKSPHIILTLGISNSQIKELKKYALENQLITQSKIESNLTAKGEEYLAQNPILAWATKYFPERPNVNVEYLKLEKTPAVLTKAIRHLAKHLIEKAQLKEFSLEHALLLDIQNCKNLKTKIEDNILNGKRITLESIYKKYIDSGLTKSLIAIIILEILSENLEKIAIYEKSQFQLKFDTLMFDRMFACPQNFELQKTEMPDEYILKDVSNIILNKKSDNILEITKGLYAIIKKLDKYTMNTQKLSPKTLRLRNIIINAKDPISLFERDIPKALGQKLLQDCDRKFLNDLKLALEELKHCTENLVIDLKSFIFDSFKTKTKQDLAKRFLLVKEYIGEKDLKTLLNTIIDTEVSDELWTNRIATYINSFRVPKDWSDGDYADFKVKAKELALKFFVLESTLGTSEIAVSENYHSTLNSLLNLSKAEQMILLRKFVNS